VSEQLPAEQPRSTKKKWLGALLLLGGPPVGGYYGFVAWKHYAAHVSTDKAHAQAVLVRARETVDQLFATVVVASASVITKSDKIQKHI